MKSLLTENLTQLAALARNSQGFDTDKVDTDSTYILVRNDFDVLDMTSGLEDLTEHIFSDSWVKTPNIQGPLVRLRGCATNEAACTVRRHDASIFSHGRGYRCRNGIRILWDDDGW